MGRITHQGYVLSCALSSFGRRRGKKRAIVAVAHSILKSVYYVLKYNVPYHEPGADYLNSQMEKKRKKYLKAELEKMGYTVLLEPVNSMQPMGA
jgi:hypothetical protein